MFYVKDAYAEVVGGVSAAPRACVVEKNPTWHSFNGGVIAIGLYLCTWPRLARYSWPQNDGVRTSRSGTQLTFQQ